jgi:hypothetical protein
MTGSCKVFAEETRALILEQGRRKTRTGRIWTLSRVDRLSRGKAPPGVVYVYEAHREHERLDAY